MNLTKVLFVTFIFLFAFSFTVTAKGRKTNKLAVAEKKAAGTKTPAGTETAVIPQGIDAIQLVWHWNLLLWACFGLIVVYPKSGAMVWILRKYPKSYFEVPQKASENIKKGYPYQIIEWVYVSYKGYLSLLFEALFLVSGVFLSQKGLKLRTAECIYIVLEYGILAVLFVRIKISSYLRWEVSTLNEGGAMVSKPVKVSDHMLRMLIFGSAFINRVHAGAIPLDLYLRNSSLNGIQWVFLLLWNSVASVLLVLYIIMLCHTVIYHHSLVDTIATAIVLIGIYVPISIIIDIAIPGIILPQILTLPPDPKVVQDGAIAKETFSKPNPGLSRSKSKKE